MGVGARDGATEGALLGEADGLGVGFPGVYVGKRVGSTVGAAEGEALGSGVGAPTDVKTRGWDDVVAMAGSLTTTKQLDWERTLTARTVTEVAEEKAVDVTVLPTAMLPDASETAVTMVEPTVVDPVVDVTTPPAR